MFFQTDHVHKRIGRFTGPMVTADWWPGTYKGHSFYRSQGTNHTTDTNEMNTTFLQFHKDLILKVA